MSLVQRFFSIESIDSFSAFFKWFFNKKVYFSALTSKIDKSSKYGETIISILTADTRSAADAHYNGLGKFNGIIFDRNKRLSQNINSTSFTNYYQECFENDSPAQLDIDASYYSDTTMQVSVSTLFPETQTDASKYRMAFVYTEDGVVINGLSYNSIARGTYPNAKGFEKCLPDTVIYDTEYLYTNDTLFQYAYNQLGLEHILILKLLLVDF